MCDLKKSLRNVSSDNILSLIDPSDPKNLNTNLAKR